MRHNNNKRSISNAEILIIVFRCKNTTELFKVAKILKFLKYELNENIDLYHFRLCANNRLRQFYAK